MSKSSKKVMGHGLSRIIVQNTKEMPQAIKLNLDGIVEIVLLRTSYGYFGMPVDLSTGRHNRNGLTVTLTGHNTNQVSPPQAINWIVKALAKNPNLVVNTQVYHDMLLRLSGTVLVLIMQKAEIPIEELADELKFPEWMNFSTEPLTAEERIRLVLSNQPAELIEFCDTLGVGVVIDYKEYLRSFLNTGVMDVDVGAWTHESMSIALNLRIPATAIELAKSLGFYFYRMDEAVAAKPVWTSEAPELSDRVQKIVERDSTAHDNRVTAAA